jgi:hypothetical protein
MSDIINRAYRKLGIIAFDIDMTADQASEGLETLNSLLHEWKLRSVDISHSDLALSGTFPLGDEYKEGVIHILAGRLSPNYEAPASFDPDDFFRAIQIAYLTVDEVTIERPLVEVPSKKARDGTLSYQGR